MTEYSTTSHTNNRVSAALSAAFVPTLPILAGFLFLGVTYGIYMNVSGFSFVYPMAMSLIIFAGSVEYVTVGLLLGAFDPLAAFVMALMINARHIFYGISMLDKYRNAGRKRFYLIFGMCDESFSINCSAKIPDGVDHGLFMLFVTLLNHIYWVAGATLGGIFGSLISFDTTGLDFVMCAMFVVIFLEQWKKDERHLPALIGIGLSALCLVIFGSDRFIVPSMLVLLIALTLLGRSEIKQDSKAGSVAENVNSSSGLTDSSKPTVSSDLSAGSDTTDGSDLPAGSDTTDGSNSPVGSDTTAGSDSSAGSDTNTGSDQKGGQVQ